MTKSQLEGLKEILDSYTPYKFEILELIQMATDALELAEFYGDPEHLTIHWVEGSTGDYGNRARAFLAKYDWFSFNR